MDPKFDCTGKSTDWYSVLSVLQSPGYILNECLRKNVFLGGANFCLGPTSTKLNSSNRHKSGNLVGSSVKCFGTTKIESLKLSLGLKSVKVTLADTVGSTGMFT